MTTDSTITAELLDQLLANFEKRGDMTGEDERFKQLKQALIELPPGAELTEPVGFEKGDPAGLSTGNRCNGTSSKTILTEDGEIDISDPRDRAGSFKPRLIAKGQTHFDGFDDEILSLYARGRTVREIQGHLPRPVRQRRLSRPHQPPHRCRARRGCGNGRTGRSTRSIRSCFLMPCGSRFATRAWSRARRSMWRSLSTRPARRKFSGCGLSRAKAPRSGSRSSTSSRPAASTIF